MKILNLTVIIASAILVTACVESSDSTQTKSFPKGKTTNTGGSGTVTSAINNESGVTLKNFNQYNQTLSKVTGIDAATPAVAEEYELIKNSLPADHGAGSFTSFHQISLTRLSFSYCNYFIDTNIDFKSLNYLAITPQDMTTKLLTKFVGARPETKYELYDQYEITILKIMNNDAGVDENDVPIGDLIPTATGALLMKNLTKLACTAILSSTEFTTL